MFTIEIGENLGFAVIIIALSAVLIAWRRGPRR